jgi:hypothetical protein
MGNPLEKNLFDFNLITDEIESRGIINLIFYLFNDGFLHFECHVINFLKLLFKSKY